MNQKPFYPVTIYMSADFVKEYFEPFLQLSKDDSSLGVNKLNEEDENIITSMSPYVRAIIKKYVNFKKKKMLENSKE
ncbi:MAG: hypothetical protein ABIH59_00895 [archaeon]